MFNERKKEQGYDDLLSSLRECVDKKLLRNEEHLSNNDEKEDERV